VNATQSTFGAQTYTINLSGGPTGTFSISGGPTGQGNYTYTTSSGSTQGHLRLDYGAPNGGDFDDMDLSFNAAPGSSTASAFTGTQKAGTDNGPLVGTFTYQ